MTVLVQEYAYWWLHFSWSMSSSSDRATKRQRRAESCVCCGADITESDNAEYGWRYAYYVAKHQCKYCGDCSAVMAADPRPGQSPLRPVPVAKNAYQDGSYWFVAVKLEYPCSTSVFLPTLASDQLAALILSSRENQDAAAKRNAEIQKRNDLEKQKTTWPDMLPLGAPSKLYSTAFLNKTESRSLVKDVPDCSDAQAAAACVTLNDEQLKRLSQGTGACLVTQWSAYPGVYEQEESTQETVLRFPAYVNPTRRVVLVTGCQLSE